MNEKDSIKVLLTSMPSDFPEWDYVKTCRFKKAAQRATHALKPRVPKREIENALTVLETFYRA